MQFDSYLPEPCLLHPEQITEYPDHLELSTELQEQLRQWSVPQAAEEDMDPQTYYDCVLSSAPGWKVGGWPAWDSTDPTPRPCPECGTGMEVLLTIATFEEGDDEGRSWSPYENPAAEPSSPWTTSTPGGPPRSRSAAATDSSCTSALRRPSTPTSH